MSLAPGGRPSARTPEITEKICEAISYDLTDEEVAAMVGIDDSTLTCWKKDPEFCAEGRNDLDLRECCLVV
jgi:hypothetical protein